MSNPQRAKDSIRDSAQDSVKDSMQSEHETMRLLLICHAEGMQDRYSDLGARNGGLTALGWEQSDALADWLRTRRALDLLVADALLQCRLTAQRIGQAVALPVTVYREFPTYPAELPRNPEQRRPARQLSALGNTSGRATDARATDGILEKTSEKTQEKTEEKSAAMPPEAETDRTAGSGGETGAGAIYAAYCRNLVEALDQLLANNWGKTVALVCDRTAILGILSYLLGGDSREGAANAQPILCVDHTSVSELIFHEQGAEAGWRLRYVNRLEHLPSPVLADRAPRDAVQPPSEKLEDLATVIRVYNRNSKMVDAKKLDTDLKRVQHLVNFAKLPADQQVLDIGTGLGLLPLLLAEEGAHTVVGIDVSPGMLEQAEYNRLRRAAATGERVSYRLAAAQTLPFHDARFDAVFCRLLLNHAQKPEQIVQEAVRVLKPGGVLILAELLSVDNSVKRATQNAIEERRNSAHVTARSAEQYTKMLEDAGLLIDAQETAAFDRELEEWLATYDVDRADRAIVREMIEAGVETDAAGLHTRRHGDTITFLQRLFYVRAVKPLLESA